MNIYLTTVSSTQTIRDLGGIRLTHPTTLDILTLVPISEVFRSTDLKSLITSGAITAVDEYNNVILSADLYGEVKYQKTKPNGYAQLDSSGLLPTGILPTGVGSEVIDVLDINDYPVYTTTQNYVSGSLKVYLQGQRLTLGQDYTETSVNTFTLSISIDSTLETVLIVDYRV